MSNSDPHRDPGADPADEWDRTRPGPTAEEWRMVARLLRDNADRFPNDSTARATAAFCGQEADRMDDVATRDAFVEQLARAMRDAELDRVPHMQPWVEMPEHSRDYYRVCARAAIDHLQPIAEWLAAEQVWKAARSDAAIERLRGDLLADPGPWPTVAAIPADVDRVRGQEDTTWYRHSDGWCMVSSCSLWHGEADAAQTNQHFAPFSRVEVSA